MKMQKSCLFFVISLSLIAVILLAPESDAKSIQPAEINRDSLNIHGDIEKRKAKSFLRVKRETSSSSSSEEESGGSEESEEDRR